MDKVPYKITKSTVEVYRFRAEGAPYWADIVIDTQAGEERGRISISSDFGDWNFYWGSCGTTFKKFLADLDQDYVAGKFRADEFFDAEKTIEAFKNTAKNTYSANSGLRENMLNLINTLENYCSRKEDFISYLQGECAPLMRMYDGTPDFIYTIDPGFKNLWEHIWPLLLEAFKVEEALPEPVIYNREDGVIEKAQLAAFTGPLSLDFLKEENNSGKVFATGVINHPTLHTEPVRWIAKVGGAEDWAIYYHNQDQSLSFVQANGNKVTTEGVIRQLVPCTDEAFGRYRM